MKIKRKLDEITQASIISIIICSVLLFVMILNADQIITSGRDLVFYVIELIGETILKISAL